MADEEQRWDFVWHGQENEDAKPTGDQRLLRPRRRAVDFSPLAAQVFSAWLATSWATSTPRIDLFATSAPVRTVRNDPVETLTPTAHGDPTAQCMVFHGKGAAVYRPGDGGSNSISIGRGR
jgi:hypothetical protein